MFSPSFDRMTAGPEVVPERWLVVLHGVFGTGRNWRLFCRSVARERPEWGFLLVDQRGHGDSLAAPPPHDVDAMADDLVGLERSIDVKVAGVMGHSLGGKVALAYAARRADALDEVWILDSQPGARAEADDSPVAAVRALLGGLPTHFDDRKAFVAELVAHGQSPGIANWLAMNLRSAGDGQRLALDLDAIGAILDDYYRRDLWSEVARVDVRRRLHLVIAGASPVWRDDDLVRAETLSLQNAAICPHVIDDSGHWVHVDAADTVRGLLVAQLH
jgi:pimeloyl-ACP methyl ester carboxylesterase